MYGFIHCCLEDMVCELFGEQAWREILKISGLKLRGASFLMHHVYDDDVTFKLVEAASQVSGWPVEICLEEFGKHFLVYCQKNGYDQILRVLGSNLFDFLTNLDNLHDHLASIYPGMRAPSFRVTRQLEDVDMSATRENESSGANNSTSSIAGIIKTQVANESSSGQAVSGAELSNQTMYLHYYSERPGLSPIVKGLVIAVAREFFLSEIVVNEVSSSGAPIKPAALKQDHGQKAREAKLQEKRQACTLHLGTRDCLECKPLDAADEQAAGPSGALEKHLARHVDNHVILKIDKVADISDPFDEHFPQTQQAAPTTTAETNNDPNDPNDPPTPANSRSCSFTAAAIAAATANVLPKSSGNQHQSKSSTIEPNNKSAVPTTSARSSGAGLSAAPTPGSESRRGSRSNLGQQEPSLLDRTSMLNIYKSLSSNEVDSLVSSEILMQAFPFHVVFNREFVIVQLGKSLLSVTSEFWKRRGELVAASLLADDATTISTDPKLKEEDNGKQATMDLLSESSTMTDLQDQQQVEPKQPACSTRGSLQAMAGSLAKQSTSSSREAGSAGAQSSEPKQLIKFGDMFQIDRPKIDLSFEAISSHTNQVFVVKTRASVLNEESPPGQHQLIKGSGSSVSRPRSRSAFRSLRKSANYNFDDDCDDESSPGDSSLKSASASPRASFSRPAGKGASETPFVSPMPPGTPYPCPLHRPAVIVSSQRKDQQQQPSDDSQPSTSSHVGGSFKHPNQPESLGVGDLSSPRRRMTVAGEFGSPRSPQRRGSRLAVETTHSSSNLSPTKKGAGNSSETWQQASSVSNIASNNNSKPSLRLKGQMIVLMGGELCLFLCSPRVDHLHQLAECGVHISDLSLADRTRELMLMSHTHKEDRENVKKLDQATNDMRRMETKLRKENQRTTEVLHNIFPAKIASLLSHGQRVESESFELVSCLYSDIIGFTRMCGSDNVKPIHIVRLLNTLYLQFDSLSTIHGVFKVETIGDAYVVVGGLPEPLDDHADRCVRMGLDMVRVIKTVRSPADGQPIQMRIGIHSGPVMAGIVGVRVPRYSLFGNTTTLANMLETQGVGNKIHISEYTAKCLVNAERFTSELNAEPKNPLPFKTFFVTEYKAANSDEEIRHELLLRESLAQDFEMMADNDQLDLLDRSSLASHLNLYRRPSVVPTNAKSQLARQAARADDTDEDDDDDQEDEGDLEDEDFDVDEESFDSKESCECESDQEDDADSNVYQDEEDDSIAAELVRHQRGRPHKSHGVQCSLVVGPPGSTPRRILSGQSIEQVAQQNQDTRPNERRPTPAPPETNDPPPRMSQRQSRPLSRRPQQLRSETQVDISSLVRGVLFSGQVAAATAIAGSDKLDVAAGFGSPKSVVPEELASGRGENNSCIALRATQRAATKTDNNNNTAKKLAASQSLSCQCSTCKQAAIGGPAAGAVSNASHVDSMMTLTDSFSEDCCSKASFCSQRPHNSFYAKALDRWTRNLKQGKSERESLDWLAGQISQAILSDAIKRSALSQALDELPGALLAEASARGDLKLPETAKTAPKIDKLPAVMSSAEAEDAPPSELELAEPFLVFGLVNLTPNSVSAKRHTEFTLHLNSGGLSEFAAQSERANKAAAAEKGKIADLNARQPSETIESESGQAAQLLPGEQRIGLQLTESEQTNKSEAKLRIRVEVADHFDGDEPNAKKSSESQERPEKCASCAERLAFADMLEDFRAERLYFQSVLADSELLSIGRRLLRDQALMAGLARYAQDERKQDQANAAAAAAESSHSSSPMGIPLSASSALKRIKRMDTFARLRQERRSSSATPSPLVTNNFGLADCQSSQSNNNSNNNNSEPQRPHSCIGQIRETGVTFSEQQHGIEKLVVRSQPSSESLRTSTPSLLKTQMQGGPEQRPLSAQGDLMRARQKRLAMEAAEARRRQGFFWALTSPLRRPLRSRTQSPAPTTSTRAGKVNPALISPDENSATSSCCFWRPCSASSPQPGTSGASRQPQKIVLRKNKPSHALKKKDLKKNEQLGLSRTVKSNNSLYRKPLQPRREM